MKLEEAIRLALQQNLDIRIERVNPKIAAQQVRGEQGAFDPKFKASIDYDEETIPLTSQASIAAGGLGEIELETLSYATSVEGKIPTGLTYNVGLDQNRAENTFNRFQSEYDSFAGMTLKQPLLKDFWLDNNLALVRIARKNQQISLDQLKLRVIGTVAKVRDAYWDLLFTVEDSKVQKESLELAADLLRENRKRVEIGVLSALEVTQAEAGVAQREESVIVSERAILDQENVLKRLICSDANSWLFTRLVPVDYPTIDLHPVEVQENVAKALKHRPDFKQAKLEIEKLDIRVKFSQNQALPRVDLEGSYGLNGLNGSSGGSFDDVGSGDNPAWTVGAAMEVPLWNRKDLSVHEIDKLRKRQLLAELKRLEQQIIVEVDNACGRVQSNLMRVEATRASRKFSEEALRAEVVKLRNGASTSHNVLEFQEELARAKSAVVKSIVDYNKSLNELAKAQGTLLEELGIQIDEK